MLPVSCFAGALRFILVLIGLSVVFGCEASVDLAQQPDSVPPSRDRMYPAPDTTYLHWDRGHGYQVTFLGKDDVWLWYPGNTIALKGAWVREEVAGRGYVCFTYPRGSFNPVTSVLSGNKQCQPQELLQTLVVNAVQGDVFDLSSGSVPYRLESNKRPEGI